MKLTPDQVRNILSAVESLLGEKCSVIVLVSASQGLNVVSNSANSRLVSEIISQAAVSVEDAGSEYEVVVSSRN